jgi:hypothetical protein
MFKLKSVMTPRRKKLLELNSHNSSNNLHWHSSISQFKAERSSEKKIISEKYSNFPLKERKKNLEESKYGVSDMKSYIEYSDSKYNSASIKSEAGSECPSEFVKEFNPKKKICSSSSQSKYLVLQDSGYSSDNRYNKPTVWPNWGPWKCTMPPLYRKRNRNFWLSENQEQVYKGALKKTTEENLKLREWVSGLQQQINELKIEVDEKDRTIDELAEMVNQLADGELDRQIQEESEN